MPRFWFFCWQLIAGIILAVAAQAQTTPITVHLAWDPSPDTNVAGYYIYAGPSSGFYTSRIDVGNVTNATIGPLNAGQTYYFTASAYTTNGVESLPSNEVNGFWTMLSIILSTDRLIHVDFAVAANKLFDLQTTTTFSNWTTLTTVASSSTTNVDVIDATWAKSPYKFYRVVPR
jgi:hypothetical protein